ncbi:MAG: serine/threonine protein kinase [Myxococcaceae bacterium]|nr:serine/threonine protein kinase [Myxococcaceae bacterium]
MGEVDRTPPAPLETRPITGYGAGFGVIFHPMADVLASDELIEEPSDYGSMLPGTRLGRYELLVPIARGGMARVWAARLHGQRGFQKLVAIKTILPHLAEEPEFERMFLDEARIASGVHHPNVCEIYELGEEKHTLYLVMEWVNGDSLARVLRSSGKTEPVDSRVVARIVADACAGLHAAHELTDEDGRALGVVHRDLSPHNILLTADGTAKVADFGVAKALGQLHEATSAGQLKGKIAYMAPEQVTGAAIDRRSDVFSLGCVLYEATTGQRPFRGDGDHQVMHAVLKGEFAAPTSILRQYPQELERIVMRALSPQPILRYPTAERMRFALEEFLARGQLVTQSNVAQVVRARIGENIDRRKERIRQASSAGDGDGGWSESPGGMTPSNQARDAGGGHRSGVKPSGQGAKPLFTTMQMSGPPSRSGGAPPPLKIAPATLPLATMGAVTGAGGPSSSTTIPQAAPHPFVQAAHAAQAPQSAQAAQGQAQQPSYPSYPAHSPPPPMVKPFAQTSLMPPSGPFTIPPVSSMPPGAMSPATMNPAALPPHAMQQQQQHQQDQHQHDPQQQMQAYGQPPSASFDPQLPAAERPSSAPGGAGHYVMAITAGVLLAVLIGVGGFLLVRHRRAPVAVEPAANPNGAATSASGGVVAPTPVPVEITFRVTPAEATLSVEGVELASGVRTVTRPAMGKSVMVVGRAKGFEDSTVLVDFFTTSPLEIALKPATGVPPVADPTPPPVASETPTQAPVARPGPAQPPAGNAPADEAAKDPAKDPPKDPPKKRLLPKNDPALPPNPF